MSAPALLDVDGLHVRYRVRGGSFEALHDVNFSLGAGEVLGVVGESGCGKSTLGAAVLGLLPANGRIANGRIALEGEDLTRMDEATLRGVRGRRVGMIFQDPLTSFNPTFRVSTQMINAQRAHGLEERNGGTSLRQRAVDMLERVGIPDAGDRIDEYPHHFSGGMRQRIMIATSLLLEPRLLICDEATSALDVTLQAQILELLRELGREQGTAIMFISHDIGVISEICEKMIILYAGRVVETGDVGSVLSQPAHPYTRRLIAAVPSRDRRHERLSMIPGRVPNLAALPPGCTFATRCDYVQRPVCDEAEPGLLTTKDRRLARCLIYAPESAYDQAEAERVAERTERSDPPPSPEVSDEVLLDLDDLCTHFGGGPGRIGRLLGRRGSPPVRAIDGVHLQLRRGEAVGLVGESGSGKTTLGKTVLNLVERTAGGITFDGQPLHELDRRGWRDMRSRMQMIFQEPHGSLSPRLSVSTLLIEPYRINDTPAGERYDVDELLEMVGLSAEQATKYPHELSGGQARRVGIARALAVRPDFIVADEPTSGLDVSAAASVLNLLADLRRQLGLTYLIITHDLNLVGYATDRIAVMYLGKIVEIAASDAIFDEPRHPYTQALLASIPDPTTRRKTSTVGAAVAGEIPSPRNPPSGCRFRTRCPYAEQRCAEEVPVLGLGKDPHGVACHFWDSIADGTKPQTGPLPAEASDAETAPVG